MPNKCNMRSVAYTTTQTFPRDTDREYFYVYVVSGSIVVEFGDGGGEIPIASGGFYEPIAIPTSKIVITPTGATFIVNSDTHP